MDETTRTISEHKSTLVAMIWISILVPFLDFSLGSSRIPYLKLKWKKELRFVIAIIIIDKDLVIDITFILIFILRIILHRITLNQTRDNNPYNPTARRGMLIPLIMML